MRFLPLSLVCAVILAAAPNSQPTFYKDVLPVLQKNCNSPLGRRPIRKTLSGAPSKRLIICSRGVIGKGS
jgi:hypothetical protein